MAQPARDVQKVFAELRARRDLISGEELRERRQPNRFSTELGELDALLGGGYPMGSLVELERAGVTLAADLPRLRHEAWVKIAGLAIVRQRPGTAKGMVFMTLEDESGMSNAALEPQVYEAHRLVVLTSGLLLIEGPLQSIDRVVTVKARRIRALRSPSEALPSARDFH